MKSIISHFYNWTLLLICSLLISNHQLYAQDKVIIKSDANQIVQGDQFKLFLEYNLDNSTIKSLQLPLPKFQGLEIVDTGKQDSLVDGNRLTIKQQFIVTGFDSGVYHIPSFCIMRGSDILAQSDSIQIGIQVVPVDTAAKFMPIKDIIPVQKLWWEYWPIALAILGLISLILAIIYFYKKRRKSQPLVTPENAHEKALRRVSILQNSHKFEQGDVKGFYSELTEIVRDYIQDRYQFSVAELTTEELNTMAKKNEYLSKIAPELKALFSTADLAKFAKVVPLISEKEDSIQTVQNIIQITKINPKEALQEDDK